jgi:hypothetical protein
MEHREFTAYTTDPINNFLWIRCIPGETLKSIPLPLRIILLSLLVATVMFHLNSCQTMADQEVENKARLQSHWIMDHIYSDTIATFFNPKFINSGLVAGLLQDFREKCSKQSCRGGFDRRFFTKNLSGPDHVSFIYIYEFDCGRYRFDLAYQLNDETFQFINLMIQPTDEEVPPARSGHLGSSE